MARTDVRNQLESKCNDFLQKISTEEELEKIQELKESGKTKLMRHKINSIIKRQKHVNRNQFGELQELCKPIWGVSRRMSRSIDDNYIQWIGWLNINERKEIDELKSQGVSFDEIKEKLIEFFKRREPDERRKIIEEYKMNCKSFFIELCSEDEVKLLAELYKAGKRQEVKEIIDSAIDRQAEPLRTQALRFQKVMTLHTFDMNFKFFRSIQCGTGDAGGITEVKIF
ncbi:hypothetical protein AB6A40_010167 [Gnathostoma spinigerum]|uniref:Polyprotein allergen nematode domain-containing protein n=1 Tax=Gnathostoma spinigerum TaxID=75299 RepID=A0ABD6F190_9BILA